MQPGRQSHANQQAIDRRVIEQCLRHDAAGDASRHGHVANAVVEQLVVVVVHAAIL